MQKPDTFDVAVAGCVSVLPHPSHTSPTLHVPTFSALSAIRVACAPPNTWSQRRLTKYKNIDAGISNSKPPQMSDMTDSSAV